MTTATYHLLCHDTDEPTPWMDTPGIFKLTPGAQDSGRVRYVVVTTDPAALESALDSDRSVISYESLD